MRCCCHSSAQEKKTHATIYSLDIEFLIEYCKKLSIGRVIVTHFLQGRILSLDFEYCSAGSSFLGENLFSDINVRPQCSYSFYLFFGTILVGLTSSPHVCVIERWVSITELHPKMHKFFRLFNDYPMQVNSHNWMSNIPSKHECYHLEKITLVLF